MIGKFGRYAAGASLVLLLTAIIAVSCGRGRGDSAIGGGRLQQDVVSNSSVVEATQLYNALAWLDHALSVAEGDFAVYRLDASYGQMSTDGFGIEVSPSDAGVEVVVNAVGVTNPHDMYLYLKFDPDSYFPARVSQGDYIADDEGIYLSIDESPGWLAVGIAAFDGREGVSRSGNVFSCRFAVGTKAPGRRVSSAPGGEANKVTDLQAAVEGESVTLTWTEVNKGDYDMNGTVGVPDITPIALSYLATVADGPGDPAHISWIDGDGSGQIGVADITPIALNYLSTLSGYAVERSDSAGFDSTELLPGGTGKVSAPRNNLNPQTPTAYKYTDQPEAGVWYYRVSPVSAADELGIASDAVIASTDGPLPLLPPENVYAIGGANFVHIAWTPSAGPAVTGYHIYYNQTASESFSELHNAEPVSGDSYVLNDLNVGVNYYFWVRSTDGEELSEFSNMANATLLPPDSDAPAAPDGLTWIRSGDDALIEWNPNSEEDVQGYDVFKSATGVFEESVKANADIVKDTVFAAAGLTFDKDWYFWVKAVDYSDNSSEASQSLLVRLDDVPPVAPVGLNGTPGAGIAYLYWFGNLESDLAGYNVYYNTSGEIDTATRANGDDLVPVSQFNVAGLEYEISYFFWITAVDQSLNESSASAPLELTTLRQDADPPAMPTGLIALSRSISVQLYWNANSESDLLGYRVYVSPIIDDPNPPLYQDGFVFNSPQALVQGLTNGKEYAFWVDALDTSMNASPRSLKAVATPTFSGLATSPWPMFGHDEKHTGRSAYVGSILEGERDPLWSSRPLDDGGGDTRLDLSFALAEDGTIYAGGDNGWFFALDKADGSVKWKLQPSEDPDPLRRGFDSSPAVGRDGTIYIGCNDGTLYAINHLTNSVKWKFETGSELSPAMIHSSPVITSTNAIIFGSRDGKLYSVSGNAPGGVKLWDYDVGGVIDFCSPAIGVDGSIYIAGGGSNPALIKLTPGGQHVWSKPIGAATDSSPSIGGSGDIYIGTSNAKVFCYSQTGQLKWEFTAEEGGEFRTPPIIGVGGTIYAITTNAILYAINSETGAEFWSYSDASPYGSSSYGHPVIDPEGNVYFCAGATIVAVGTSPGPPRELWHYNLKGFASWSTPIIDAAGTVIVGCGTSGGGDTVFAFRD